MWSVGSVLLLSSVLSALLCPALSQSAVWSNTMIDVPRRGLACTAYRVYDPATGNYTRDSPLILYSGGYDGSNYLNDVWQVTAGSWSVAPYPAIAGDFLAREGHFFHTAGGITADTVNLLVHSIGAGINTSLSAANTVMPAVLSPLTNAWQAGVTDGPNTKPGVPLQYPSWGYSSAVTVDSRYDPRYSPLYPFPSSNAFVQVIYGGLYNDPVSGSRMIDDQMWVINGLNSTAQLDVIDPSSFASGNPLPWSEPRHGMAMVGFSATSGFNGRPPHNNARGRIIMMGGIDKDSTLSNDVFVIWDDRYPNPDGRIGHTMGFAAWSPRWGSQAIDGGYTDVFLYGGYDSTGAWQTDMWYASFAVINGDPWAITASSMVWKQVNQVSAGPTYKPGCTVAHFTSNSLHMVMMGAATDGKELNPEQGLYYASVTRP